MGSSCFLRNARHVFLCPKFKIKRNMEQEILLSIHCSQDTKIEMSKDAYDLMSLWRENTENDVMFLDTKQFEYFLTDTLIIIEDETLSEADIILECLGVIGLFKENISKLKSHEAFDVCEDDAIDFFELNPKF